MVGAGDATGGAIARRFAREGYAAVCTRRECRLEPLLKQIRNAGGEAHGFGSDARIEAELSSCLRPSKRTSPRSRVVFNIGANVNFPIRETTERVYRKVWEMAALGGFLAGREAAKVMVPRGRARSSSPARQRRCGRSGFSAFAGAKFALRALAQSMARELGPHGVHVAHTIIDGAIDTEWIAKNFPQRHALKDQDGILNPEHIADAYWMLHSQPRDAWTHELDLRPWMEKMA